MDEKVVKHRNYTFFYIIMIIFVVLAFVGGLYYFNASMDHTTVIEKGFILIYKYILKGISAVANLF